MTIAELNNQGIYFEDSGGDESPIMFMHGFLMDHEMFDPQVAVLTPRYRCVRFDARAFGKTQWDGQPFTLHDTAADCIGLMDHLKIPKATIIGMSQGGFAALRLALKHPDRVKALVLIATQAGTDGEEFNVGFRGMRDTWREQGPIPDLLEGNARMILGPKEGKETGPLWEKWIPKWQNQTGEQIFHAVNNCADRDDITEQMEQITIPALVIHGEADEGAPISVGEALDKALPNSKGLIRVPSASHAVNLSHPQAVNSSLVEFLNEYG